MEKTHNSSRRLALFIATAILAGAASYAIGYSGLSPVTGLAGAGHALAVVRCDTGIGLAHSARVSQSPDVTLSATRSLPIPDYAAHVQTSGSNLVANPGVEQLTGTLPTGWKTLHTGTNDASFSQVLGHSSPRAVRVDVSSYRSGEAAWTPSAIAITPGAYYTYSDYYRANVSTVVMLTAIDAAGKEQTYSLGSVPASLAWKAAYVRFAVPTDTRHLVVYQALASAGSLETDDFSLMQTISKPFARGMVSVTFDNGWRSVYVSALPVMQRYGITATVYMASGFIGKPNYLTAGDLNDLQADGSEIASDTVDELNLTKLSSAELHKQLALSQATLKSCYGQTDDLALPFGSSSPSVVARAADYYETARTMSVGLNTADAINPYSLKVVPVTAATTAAQLEGWLMAAKINHAWLILVYHGVDKSGSPYSRTPTLFEADMQQVVTSGLAVDTVHQAYIAARPAFSK